MRSAEEISAIIDKFDLTKREGINDLERYVRKELTICEIEHFASYLHGGIFLSTPETDARTLFQKIANGNTVDIRWTRCASGCLTLTHEEDSALSHLWERLLRDAHFSLGAAAVVEMQSARYRGRTFFTDEGDGPSLYDLTLDEIAKKIPHGLKDRIDRDLAPELAKRKKQAASIAGDVAAKQKELDQGAEFLERVLAENAELKAKLEKNGIS